MGTKQPVAPAWQAERTKGMLAIAAASFIAAELCDAAGPAGQWGVLAAFVLFEGVLFWTTRARQEKGPV
jgi:hypothetical protein